MFISKLLLVLISFTAWSDTDTTLDLSGSPGQDATDGRSYSTRPGASFSNGTDAGHASASRPGQNGGDMDLRITGFGQGGQSFVRIYGQIDSIGRVDRNIRLSSESQISLLSQGGSGGDGGVGGDGQGGCNGSDGSDASESSNGTNGGPGCRGGDAGRGSPGSNGGDGGNIRLHIPIEDIQLSLLVQCDVSAGDGGSRGEHGDPGSGGRGGDGGSSHSWSEQTGESCTSSSVDNGNGSFSTVESCTPTYTSYSNSGGFDGPNGSDGNRATGPLQAGSDGRDGTCVFTTESGGQRFAGSQPFNLKVVSYRMYDENRDGIYEPLEKFYIDSIVVENTGDLPSPSNTADFNLLFRNTNYTSPEPKTVTLPRVDPGSSFSVSEVFEFSIQDNYEVGVNQRLVLQDAISPQNRITEIDRAQAGFENVRNFVVTYPIEVRAFTLQDSVGAGEEIPIFWSIKNNSNIDFGGEAGLREIITELSVVGGDADPSLFSFTGENGEPSPLSSAQMIEILSLAAGEEVLIEGTIKVSEQALAYTGVQIGQELSIENLLGDLREIQRDSLSLRISQLYRHRANSEFLLLTNTNTEREEFIQWQNIQSRLGTTMDVWDFSYYGALSFTNALSQASGRTLQDILQNKTIVVLNKMGSETRDAFSMIEMAEQLSRHQTNLVVIGGEENELRNHMYDLLSVPFSRPEEVETEDLMQTFWNWVSPEPENFVAMTEDQSQSLIEDDPNARFFMRVNYRPELIENGWFRDSYKLGEITYTRTLTPGGGRAAFLPLTRREMLDFSYVRSEEVLRALLLPTSFSYKVDTLEESEDYAFRGFLKDAALHDLVLEIDLKELECIHGSCDPELGLSRLIDFIDKTELNSLQSEKAYILAALDLYAEELDSRALRRGVKSLLGDFTSHPAVDETLDSLKEDVKNRERLLVGISDRENLRNLFTYPAVFRTLTTDRELNSGNSIRN